MHLSQYLTTVQNGVTQHGEVCEAALQLFPAGHAAAVRPLIEVGQAFGRILAPHTARQMAAIEDILNVQVSPEQAGTIYGLLFLHPEVVRMTCLQVARILPTFAEMATAKQAFDALEEGGSKPGSIDHLVRAAQVLRELRIDQVIDLAVSVVQTACEEVDHLLGIQVHLTGGEIRTILFTMVPTMLEFYGRFSLQYAESVSVIAQAVQAVQELEKRRQRAKARFNGRQQEAATH